GDGNVPTGLQDPADDDNIQIVGHEAISMLGVFNDKVTNTGTIIGGTAMGGGNDTLINSRTMSEVGGSAIDMGERNDSVPLQEGAAVLGKILLGAGADTLTAVDGDLDIDGGAGNDTITTGAGDDTIAGNTGDDVIDAGDGDDVVDGGDDDDTLKGSL